MDYSGIAQSYDRVRSMEEANLDRWVSELIACGGIRSGHDVLEIGCGTGRFTVPLWERTHANICGLDNSREMLDIARSRSTNDHITWIPGDAEQIALDDNSFDCVFMYFVLHHLADQDQAVREIFRLLRPNGRVVIATASHGQIRREFLYKYFPGLLQMELSRFPSIPALKEMLRNSGFDDIGSRFLTCEAKLLSKQEYGEWMEKKPISTFYLLDDDDFEKGLNRFLDCSIGDALPQIFVYHSCYYVTATKP